MFYGHVKTFFFERKEKKKKIAGHNEKITNFLVMCTCVISETVNRCWTLLVTLHLLLIYREWARRSERDKTKNIQRKAQIKQVHPNIS